MAALGTRQGHAAFDAAVAPPRLERVEERQAEAAILAVRAVAAAARIVQGVHAPDDAAGALVPQLVLRLADILGQRAVHVANAAIAVEHAHHDGRVVVDGPQFRLDPPLRRFRSRPGHRDAHLRGNRLQGLARVRRNPAAATRAQVEASDRASPMDHRNHNDRFDSIPPGLSEAVRSKCLAEQLHRLAPGEKPGLLGIGLETRHGLGELTREPRVALQPHFAGGGINQVHSAHVEPRGVQRRLQCLRNHLLEAGCRAQGRCQIALHDQQ